MLSSLSATVQEAIIIAVAVVILVLLALLGAARMQIKALEANVEQGRQALATCTASNAQLKLSVAAQNTAVEAAKKEGDERVAAAQAAAAQAAANAAKLVRQAQAQVEAMRNAKPDNPKDLCGSAQRTNAQFIKERQ